MRGEDLLSSILLPGEQVLWSGEAEKSLGRKLAPVLAFALGLATLGSSVHLFYSRGLEALASSNWVEGFLAVVSIVGTFFLGLSLCVFAWSEKPYIPSPRYFVTQKRAVVLQDQRDGSRTVIARFVEAGRYVEVEARRKHFTIIIPVKREFDENKGFILFERLSKESFDGAMSQINPILGGTI